MEKIYNEGLSIFLAIIVIVVCVYFIATSSWFDLSLQCPEGTRMVETVWNEGTPNERIDRICVQGEE